MKKLTVALIAVFLFPASFAMTGEHPAFADQRPSLVNDDLAFAFHGDVPLQAEFLSDREMTQTTGDALPLIVWWVAYYFAADRTVDFLTDKNLARHAKKIIKRTMGNLYKYPPESIDFDAEFEKMTKQPNAALMRAEINKMLAHKQFAYYAKAAAKAFLMAVGEHAATEWEYTIKSFGLSEEDLAQMDPYTQGMVFDAAVSVAQSDASDVLKKSWKTLGITPPTSKQISKAKLNLPYKNLTRIKPIVNPPSQIPTWTPSESGEENFGAGLNPGGSDRYLYETYGGGYQTGYCSGNTCTVTWHYGSPWRAGGW
ncbi:MAG: hypothetical protein ISN29_07110 [Gammaproteobacteria bacterium AqS3]|nr:hypothetical protein [Gammaproteobacteria bacterium AqS3]